MIATSVEPAEAALDVEELFRAQVGAEAGLGEDDIAERQAELGGHDGIAAVRDVAEGSAVHQRGPALEGLHQVRQHRILGRERHVARGVELKRRQRLQAIEDAGALFIHIPSPAQVVMADPEGNEFCVT